MTDSIWRRAAKPKSRSALRRRPARRRAAWLLLALAAPWCLATPPATSAQQEQQQGNCLQDKKLDIADPGREKIDYRGLRNKNVLSERDKQIIDRVVKFNVYRLSWPEQRKGGINQIRHELVGDANDAPSRAFRREVATCLLKYLPDLFDNQCVVRMVAAHILKDLNDDQDFEAGVKLLIDQLNKPDQYEGFKLVACQAIQRLGTKGFRFLSTRDAAIDAVVQFLQHRDQLNPWTQAEAVKALGAMGARAEGSLAVGDRVLLPAIEQLLEALHASSGPPRVRARAAEAIGGLDVSNLQAKLNYQLVAHETALAAVALGREYVARFDQLQLTEDIDWWKFYFALLLKGFRGDLRETGLVRMAASDPEQLKFVKAAEAQLVALTKAVLDPLSDQDDIRAQVDAIQAWADQNPPPDRRLAPQLNPLPEPAPVVSP